MIAVAKFIYNSIVIKHQASSKCNKKADDANQWPFHLAAWSNMQLKPHPASLPSCMAHIGEFPVQKIVEIIKRSGSFIIGISLRRGNFT
jgi:hypothetical protein